jgi:hypothetical protein
MLDMDTLARAGQGSLKYPTGRASATNLSVVELGHAAAELGPGIWLLARGVKILASCGEELTRILQRLRTP